MSDDGLALYEAVLATPDDLALKRVYADWLEEHGDNDGASLFRVIADGDVERAMEFAGIEVDEFQANRHGRAIVEADLPDDAYVSFAVKCARRVLSVFESQFPNDRRPRQAIEVADSRGGLEEAWTVASQAGDAPTYRGDPMQRRDESDWRIKHAAMSAQHAAMVVYTIQNRIAIGSGPSEVARYAALSADLAIRAVESEDEEAKWQMLRLCEFKAGLPTR